MILSGLHWELLTFSAWHSGSINGLNGDFHVYLYKDSERSAHTQRHTQTQAHTHRHFFLAPKFCLLLYGQNSIQIFVGLHNYKIEAEV